ncbi:MAG: hypothetical protein LUI10_06570 [Lachnospiraceae bacterium]|nr:hypothetical protein [Lachnospiraceae bacterium]
MRRNKEDREYDFDLPEEKQSSAREAVLYVVILVALVAALIVLGVLIWRVSRGIFGSEEKETVEVTEQLEEENTEMELTSGESGETSGESGQETETGSADAGAESSESQSESSESASDDSQQAEAQENQNTGSTQTGTEQTVTEASADEQNADTSTVSMTFTEVSETVMAKSATNLRSEPSTESADTVVVVLESGIQVTRTGINADTGWSRLSYDGQVLYAVSSLLTTDLSGQTTGEVASDPDRVTTQDGRVIIFTGCNDTVSPKMSVNLRTEPSTSQGNATVYYELQYGETVSRTGYDADAGWSRVEYNGQTLYAVTSYLYVVE